MIKIERECVGYEYTAEADGDRTVWSVTTDYINDKIYLSGPDDEEMDQMLAYGKAIVKACRDMKREMKDNRFEV